MHAHRPLALRARGHHSVLVVLVLLTTIVCTGAGNVEARDVPTRQDGPTAASPQAAPTIDVARHLFYSGRYTEASAMALAIREHAPEDLATFELRTSAIHFQIKRALGDPKDDAKASALKACGECPALITQFTDDTTSGRTLARARLDKDPNDVDALFYIGKLDLNYVWLQTGTLGRRTGWSEYREARRSLDDVLAKHANHVRARVARAWIDYIVDTKVKFGFRWILGGGDKKKALVVMRDTASNATDHFERTEAAFGLWEMEIREKDVAQALSVAKELARDFPENRELAKFIAAQSIAPASVKK